MILLSLRKKINIFNRDRFTSAVQASNRQQQWQQRDAAREPQEFLEFVNESVCGVAIRKFGPIPLFGGFRSKICFAW